MPNIILDLWTALKVHLYPWALSPEKWKFIFTENVYMNVHSSFTCNGHKLEFAQMSFLKWMVKQAMVHPYHGILLGNKKEQTTDTQNKLNDSPADYAEWKMLTPRGYRLYDSIYVSFFKWQYFRYERQISGAQRVEGGGQGGVCCYKRTTWEIFTELALTCSDGYMNPHRWQNCTKLKYAHREMSTSKTEEIWINSVDISVPISWLWYCTKVL